MFSPLRLRRFTCRVTALTMVLGCVAVSASCGRGSKAGGAPYFQSVAPVFMSEGQTRRVPLRAGLDGQEVGFRLGEEAPAFASIELSDLILTPGYDDSGKYEVEILAAVGEGPATSRVVVVNVADVNRPPVIGDIDPVTVDEGEIVHIDLEVVDPDGEEVSLDFEGSVPAFASLEGEVLTLAPDFDAAGEYTLTIRATDERRVSAKVVVKVTVVDVDRPPVFRTELLADHLSDDRLVIVEGAAVVLRIEATDPDGDEVTIFLEDGAPEWVWFNAAADELELTPGFLDSGVYGLTLVAEANGALTRWELPVDVLDVNRSPVFEPVESIYVEAGQVEIVELNAWDPDPEDATLLVTADLLPSWIEISGLRLFLSPPADLRGVFPLVLRVTDRAGEYVEQAISVFVVADSAAPAILEFAQRLGSENLVAGVDVDSVPLIWARAADPNGRPVRVQVEVRRLDLPFTDTPTHHSVLVPGGEVSVPLGALAAGEYKWQARAINSNDNHSDWIRFAGGGRAFRLKEKVLNGSLSVESYDGWTRHRTVRLTLQATPSPGANLRDMAFSNDGENFGMTMPWQTSAVWTLGEGNDDDEHVIHAVVTDDLLNSGRFQTVVRVDDTPPAGTFVINEGQDYTTSRTVLLHSTLSDGESGPYRVCFSNHHSGPWASCTETSEPVEWTLLAGDGGKTVYARLEDIARNAAYLHADVVLDESPPDTRLIIDGGATFTNSREVVLQVETSDFSGIKELCFAGEGQSFGNCTTPRWRRWTLPDADGVHTVRARAEDVAGNRGIGSASIHLDRVAPTVSLAIPGAIPRDGYIELRDEFLTLAVDASDDGSGLAGVQFSGDGITWTPLENPSADRPWPTNDEPFITVHVRAVDNAGNVSEIRTALIHLVPEPTESGTVPRLLINGGAPVTTEREVVLSFDTSALGGSDGLTVALSNDGLFFSTPVPLTGTMEWELADGVIGDRTVHARVTDTLGLEHLVSAQIVWDPDHDDPSFVVVNDGGTGTGERDVTLTYGSFPPGRQVTDVCVSDDGATFTCGFDVPVLPGSSAAWQLPDADGDYTITVRFELDDASFLFASASISLNRSAPVLQQARINNGALWTASRAVELWVDVSSVEEPATLCAGEDPADLNCAPFAYPSPFLLATSGGPVHDIHVRVGDAAGNWSDTIIASIGYDPEPPVISSVRLQPGVGLVRIVDGLSLEVVAEDLLSGLAALSVSHDDGATWTAPEPFAALSTLTLPPGPDGNRTVWVRVFDEAGNVAEASANILVDTEPPAVDLVLGDGSGWTRENQVDVHLFVSDAFGGNAYCLSDEEVESAPLTNCEPWINMARVHPNWPLADGDGVREVYAYVRDQAGNVGMTVGQIQVRSTAPNLGKVVLNGGAEYARDPELTVGVVVNESNLSDMLVEFSGDGTHWSPPRPLQSPMTWTLPNETNGERTVHVRVTEPAGNSAKAFGTIVLDTQPPTGQVRINGGATIASSSTVLLDLTWSDNVGVTHYCARNAAGQAPPGSNACWQPVADKVSHDLVPGDGNRTVFVHFRDGAGNVSQATSASIRVETSPPELAGFDEAGTWARHRGVDVAWHPAKDTGKGVAGYRVGWSTNNQHFEWLPEQANSAVSIGNLPNGRPVFVRYRAYDEVGNFAESPSVELTPDWPFSFHHRLPAPTDLRAAASTGGIILAVGDAGLLLRSTSQGDVWRRMDPMVDDDLTDVAFRDTSRAAISTRTGEVLLTRDGGFTWVATSVSENPLHAIRWVRSSGGADVWLVAGEDGLFTANLSTYDGSETWSPVTLPAGLPSQALHEVALCPEGTCPSGDHAVAVIGQNGVLLRSTDGGVSFVSVDTGGVTFSDLAWMDGSFHLVSDQNVYELHGTALSMSSAQPAPFVLRGITVSGAELYVVGAKFDGREGAVASFTSDGTFAVQELPEGILPLTSAVSLDSTTLLAFGEGGTFVRRSAGEWASLSSGTTDAFEAAALSGSTAWFAGEGGRVVRVDRTTGQLTALAPFEEAAQERWRGVAALNGDELVLVGESGRIVRTVDGGASFLEEEVTLSDPSFRAVSCVSHDGDTGCVATGHAGALVFSLNGNHEWAGISVGASTELNAVVATGFEGEDSTRRVVGFAAGSDGRIWSFSGTGASSQLVTPAENQALFGVDAGNGTWVTVGANGFIARSTNSGELWSASLVPAGFAEDVLSVAYAGEGVWFASSSGGSVLKSIDDGLSWFTAVTGTRGRLASIVADGESVWVAGSDGTILESDTAAE